MSSFITTNHRRAAFEAETKSAALNSARLDADTKALIDAKTPGPSYPAAWRIAARELLLRGEFADAVEALRNAVSLHPPRQWSTGVDLVARDR